MNLVTIFLTGLFTGGLSCLAVQGGLLAATIAQREEEKLEEKTKNTGNALPILFFLLAKLAAYTLLGLLLGWFGSVFQLSLTAKLIMQIAVVIFMFGTAGNLLNLHPIFRYFVIQPPKFLTKLIRNQSKSNDFFAPALLGAFTVFIPCGTTQAMMALAIASGNPLLGAAIMFAFTVGTSPVFFLLGYFATKLSETLHQKFMKVAAYSILALAVFNLNSAVALTGSNFTLENLWQGFYCTISFCDPAQARASGNGGSVAGATTNRATISFEETGYNPNIITVKAGSTVTLDLVNKNGRGCIQAFTIPKLNIQKTVPVGGSDSITFTAPTQKGELAFMCSMGMIRGKIQVI